MHKCLEIADTFNNTLILKCSACFVCKHKENYWWTWSGFDLFIPTTFRIRWQYRRGWNMSPYYCKVHFVSQNQENIDFQMLVIYLNSKTLKKLLLQSLVAKAIFSWKLVAKKNSFYLWLKYESMCTDFTPQKVILSVNLLVQTKTTVWTVNSGHMGSYFAHR